VTGYRTPALFGVYTVSFAMPAFVESSIGSLLTLEIPQSNQAIQKFWFAVGIG
jgi:hypothetical protein